MSSDRAGEPSSDRAGEPSSGRVANPSSEGTGEPQYCTYTEYREGERGTDDPEDPEVPATGEGAAGLERDVWDALYAVDDPEMPVSVVDLGLIYDVRVDESTGHAAVDMTLTYTGCPAREMLRGEIRGAVAAVDGVEDVDLRLVWSPPWSVEMVTERGKRELREFGLSV